MGWGLRATVVPVFGSVGVGGVFLRCRNATG